MKFCVVCSKGLEDSVIFESRDYNLNFEDKEDYLVTLSGKKEDFLNFTFYSQSGKNYFFLDSIIERDKLDSIDKIEGLSHINEDIGFKVNSQTPYKEIKSLTNEIAAKVGEKILNGDNNLKVEIKNPKIVVYAFFNKKNIFIGTQINKKSLDNREYRLFLTSSSLKGSIAFWSWVNVGKELGFESFKKFTKYLQDKKICDIFGSTGEISIELMLKLTNQSHNLFRQREVFFDWARNKIDDEENQKEFNGEFTFLEENMRELNFAKKNAKSIEVDEFINFSKTEIEFLDVKYGEEEIDVINSKLIQPGPVDKMKKFEKKYKEIFYQLQYTLSKTGIVSLIFTKKDVEDIVLENAKSFGFNLRSKYIAYLGEQEIIQLILEKDKNEKN